VPLTMTVDDLDGGSWWRDFKEADALKHDLSQLLPSAESWERDGRVWGDYEGDIFEVAHDRDQIIEVSARIDLRNLSLPYVANVTQLARRYDLLLVTEDRHILRPSFRELWAAIQRSSGFRFVQDPQKFVAELDRRRAARERPFDSDEDA
jgi:hypothetical protein